MSLETGTYKVIASAIESVVYILTVYVIHFSANLVFVLGALKLLAFLVL
jgi:hypothetical protein